MKHYIAALDQGTTSSRCVIFDRQGHIVGMAQREFTQIYPQPGWVEQDPMEIWSSQYSVLTEAVAQTGIEPEGWLSPVAGVPGVVGSVGWTGWSFALIVTSLIS